MTVTLDSLSPLVSYAAIARVVQSAGDDSFKNCAVWVRIPPRVPNQISDFGMRISEFLMSNEEGFMGPGKSEIRMTQSEILLWVVAQRAEHRTVTAAIEGSNPFDPPNSIADCGFQIADFSLVSVHDCVFEYANQQSAISNPQSAFRNRQGTVAER